MVSKESEKLELTGLGPSQRRVLRRALREGREVELRMSADELSRLHAPSIGPLVHALSTGSPEVDAQWQRWRAPAGRDGDGPGVTVVVPTHRCLPIGLNAWIDQDLPVRVLVLSNGKAGPMEAPRAEVLRVPWEGHGATRQAAVDHVEDPYILFTVDDALPMGRGFLRRLVEALEGGGWDAVIARQVAWPDADPVTVKRLQAWTPASSETVQVAQTDHVATLYRSRDLRSHPLPSVPIAEDAWWSRGRRIACVPSAPIVHSHTRRPGELYRRTRDIHAERSRMGEPASVPSMKSLVGALPSTLRPMLGGHPVETLNQLAELLGQYRGGRRAG